MRNYFVAVVAVLGIAVAITSTPTQLDGRVKDTPHNLNTQGGITLPNGEVCVPCHAPHNTDDVVGFLWNHESTTTVFTTHNPTDVISQTSRMCLSCHDGTVALDSYGGGTGTQIMGGTELLGTTLVDDHPIGVDYPATGTFGYNPADVDGNIVDATETPPNQSAHLENNRVQCVSCHFAHGSNAAYGKFLRVDNTGSALCMTCHVTPG